MIDTVLSKAGKIASADKLGEPEGSEKLPPYHEITNERNQVFISYSRDDSAWMREIRDHIDRLPDFNIDSWVDKNRMDPGDWIDQKIKSGLDESTIALLLISPTFVKSEYIKKKEIPWIFERADKGQLKIVYVPIFDLHETHRKDKTAVEDFLTANEQLDKSLSTVSFGNALEATFERQDKSARDGKVKEVIDGIRRVIDPYFSKLEQALPDDYQIICKISEGASAVIYRARKEGVEGDRAVKVLKYPKDIKWFQRSLRKASAISNASNIIPIFDHRFRSSMSYCVLKYIEGERLSRYIQNTSPVSTEFTSNVLTKIGTAVAQVRQESVFQNVFFNIRPENVLVEFDTLEPYLSLAVRTENRRGEAHLEAMKKHVSRASREAWGYIVPEYVRPQNFEPDLEVADQYLLGLMGYQMLSGEVPIRINRDKFLKGGPVEFIEFGSVVANRSFNHLMPIVAKMINIDPAMRFQSLSAALEALSKPKEHSLSVVEESFRRCVRDEVSADVFFDEFYQRLIINSSEIKSIFSAHGYAIDSETGRGRGVKWIRQRQMLCHAVLLSFKYFEDRIRESISEPNILTFARNKHATEKIKAGPEAYEHFLVALLETVKMRDPEWDETYHSDLWRAVIKPGLDYMQN